MARKKETCTYNSKSEGKGTKIKPTDNKCPPNMVKVCGYHKKETKAHDVHDYCRKKPVSNPPVPRLRVEKKANLPPMYRVEK